MAHESLGDLRVRALPSPVCTAWPERQNRWQETVTDRGECPAQRRYAVWFATTNVHCLLTIFPTLTRVVCCPSAAFRRAACSVGDAPAGRLKNVLHNPQADAVGSDTGWSPRRLGPGRPGLRPRSGGRRVQPHGGEVGPDRPGVVSPAVDPGGPLERGRLPEQWDQGRVAYDPLVDPGPHGRPAVPVGFGQGPIGQPVHLRVVVLAEVVLEAEAAVVLGQDRPAGVVAQVVQPPDALRELVLQALGGVPERLEGWRRWARRPATSARPASCS
jgi:hypothetical protein